MELNHKMSGKLIISSLLLAGSTASVAAQDLQTSRTEIQNQQQKLIDSQYLSAEILTGLVWDAQTQMLVEGQFQINLKFIAIERNYRIFDGDEEPLDYEVIVERVNASTGDIQGEDTVYMAKRLSDGKFKLYDCDSTASCSTDYFNSIFYAFDTPEGQGLRFRDASDVFSNVKQRNLVFHRVNN